MDFVSIIKFAVLLLCFIFINKWVAGQDPTYAVPFVDNGNRVKIEQIVVKLPARDDQCTLKTLRKCKVSDNFSCSTCAQLLARCVHFSETIPTEDGGMKVPANSSPDEGYCLYLPDSPDAKTCNYIRGGRWIIASDPTHERYNYICYCSAPQFFTPNILGYDCDVFNGCRNGRLADNVIASLADVDCVCNDGFKKKFPPENQKGITPIQCERKNLFEWPDDTLKMIALDESYLNPDFRGHGLTYPNPCLIDLYSMSAAKDSGRLVQDPTTQACYCVATNENFVAIQLDDDYLLNNGGHYPNAVCRVTKSRSTECANSDGVVDLFVTSDTPDTKSCIVLDTTPLAHSVMMNSRYICTVLDMILSKP